MGRGSAFSLYGTATGSDPQMIEFVRESASELLAVLALVLAVVSNWRWVVERRKAADAERRLEALEKAGRQTEYLIELEKKNAAVGQVTLVTAQKLLLLRENPGLSANLPGEQERLETNLDLMRRFRDDEEKQREIAEHPSIGSDPKLYHQALMNTRRLRVRLESEAEKEREVYRELAQSVSQENL